MTEDSRDAHAYQRWFMLATILLGFGLRTYRLGYQELRGDETFGYFFSLPSFGQIIQRTFELQEPHPVASYFVQSVWLDWAGHSEYALRFPSVWFSLLAVALLLRFAWTLGFKPAAICVSGLLLAVSPYAIWHSQDARMYSMSLALTIASAWLFVALIFPRTIQHHASQFFEEPTEADAPIKGDSGYLSTSVFATLPFVLGYLLITWLALHTHYFSAFVIVSQDLFALLLVLMPLVVGKGFAKEEAHTDRKERGQWRGLRVFLFWMGVQIVLALAYLPWLIRAREILTDYGGNGDSPTLLAMLGRALRTFAFGETISPTWAWLWVWVAVALVGLGIVAQIRENQNRAGFLLLYLLTPLLATWVSALQRPIFDERYLIAAAPPFLLFAASGLTASMGSLYGWLPKVRKRAGHPRIPLVEHPKGIIAPKDRFWGLPILSGGLAILVAVGTILSLSNHYTNPAYSKTIGWRQLAQTFDRLSSGYTANSVRLVQNYPDPTLWYYYQGEVEHLVLPPGPADTAGTIYEVGQFLAAAPSPIQHIVIALQPADNWDNSSIAQQALATEFALIGETNVASWPVQVYARPPAGMDAVQGGNFVNGLQLSHAEVAPLEVVPGSILSIHLGWRGSSDHGSEDHPIELTGTEKLFLHLMGPDNALVAQKDVPLVDGDANKFVTSIANSSMPATPSAHVVSYGIFIPTDAPPGPYRLLAGLYDPAESGAPRILTTNGRDSVIIADLELNK